MSDLRQDSGRHAEDRRLGNESADLADARPAITGTKDAADNGGRTTISPPSNVSQGEFFEGQVFLSGTDTLVFSLDLSWKTRDFFERLDELKAEAALVRSTCALILKDEETDQQWSFAVKGYGSKGYAWLMDNKDYSITIGDWFHPMQRPSAMVSVRSETLWALGRSGAVDNILRFFEAAGAKVWVCKPSRLDLCVDFLLKEETWRKGLEESAVTRAAKHSQYGHGPVFTGMMFGKSDLSVRLYDKGFEILTASGKTWFLDLWELPSVPDGYRMIRVEFQSRREFLKNSGINLMEDLARLEVNLWSYLTTKWFKFVDRPDLHHTQQKVLSWWSCVQSGFEGAQDAKPVVRGKALKVDSLRVGQQLGGQMTSLIALQPDEDAREELSELSNYPASFVQALKLAGIDQAELDLRVELKKAKWWKTQAKWLDVLAQRLELEEKGSGA